MKAFNVYMMTNKSRVVLCADLSPMLFKHLKRPLHISETRVERQ